MGSILERGYGVFGGTMSDSLSDLAAHSTSRWYRGRSHLIYGTARYPTDVRMSPATALQHYGFYACERARQEGSLEVVNVHSLVTAIKRRYAMFGVRRNEFLHDAGISSKDWDSLCGPQKWGEINAQTLMRVCELLGLDFHKLGVFAA